MAESGFSGLFPFKHVWDRLPSWAWPLGAFLLAFGYGLHIGRIGFHPLDSPIVFDGGYRILQGQTYLSDFFAPSGFFPSWLQAGFFRLFGVNWFAYCLHAALLNGCFALLVYHFLRRFRAPRLMAFAYATLSGLIFYAPIGTPYPEQHAFFFALLGLYALIVAPAWGGRWQKAAWMAVGPAFVLALLCKQVPTAYLMVLGALLLPCFLPRKSWPQALLYLGLGTLLGLLLAGLLLKAWNLEWEVFRYYLWDLPREVGASRVAEQGTAASAGGFMDFLHSPFHAFSTYKDPYLIFFYGLPILALSSLFLRRRWPQLALSRIDYYALALATGLVIVSALFIQLTYNQWENGIPYFFLQIGLYHLVLLRFFEGGSSGKRIWIWRGFAWGMTALLGFYLLIHSAKFHRKVNWARKVHDFPPEQVHQAGSPEGFSGLEWLYWEEPWRGQDRRMEALVDTLNTRQQPFFYFGDMTFLYGLMDQPNPLPCLWLHPGLTFPRFNAPQFEAFEDQALESLNALQPRMLIAESQDAICYKEIRLRDFPRISAWVEARKGRAFRIGAYYCWELSSGNA